VKHLSIHARKCETKLKSLARNKHSSLLARKSHEDKISFKTMATEQKAELVRVSQSFLLVPNLHWIVVEDSKNKTRFDRITFLLQLWQR
jgi:hypothetical protein